MTDSKETPEPRKVIDGSAAAAASPSAVAVNDPVPATRFCVSELVHHRYDCDPDTGREKGRTSLIEFHVTQGIPPEKWSKFQGLGMLKANTPPKQQGGMGMVQREYRFNIYAETVEEAWDKFESFNERGAKQAEDSFRQEYAEWQKAMSRQIALPGHQGGAGILGPGGQPL